jgi:biotin carboxyl carrier protein
VKYLTTVNDKTFEVEISADGRILVNGEERAVDFVSITESLYSALINQRSVEAVVEQHDSLYQVQFFGDVYEVEVLDERDQRLMRAAGGVGVGQGELSIKSPMPGLILAIRVQEGQAVEKGTPLFVLESMKMENEIKSPRAGTVGRIQVSKGDSVEQNKVLMTLI